jgi:MFS family permease
MAMVINMSLLAALGTMTSTILAPSVPQLMKEFHQERKEGAILAVSVYLLGVALGFLVLPGWSERHGRTIVFQFTNMIFLFWAGITGVSNSLGMLIGCRFILGISAAASQSVFGGVLSDIFVQEEQAKPFAMISMGMIVGPLLGPIFGGCLASWKGWRIGCWFVVVLVAGFPLH